MTPEQAERLQDEHKSDAPWDKRTIGWKFTDARALPEPIPMRGQLGLFAVDEEILQIVAREEV